MLNVIIFGAPGCGKGTQSALIIDKFKLKHFSTGEVLRKEIDNKTEIGVEADSYISRGQLVPDEMINKMVAQTVQSLNSTYNGIIFDGYPRTVKQAEELEKMMNEVGSSTHVLVELTVPDHELINRLLSRGLTSGRNDDNLEVISKRLEVYGAKTAPVIEFYKSLNKYVPIDGLGSIEEVNDRIVKAIDDLY
ncbi:MAG: adenylate kinase [Bacteroidales bacterium 36-12]|nr:MAG: adenylate kinase [Bacteroidales bacterium 36-12]